MPCYPITLNQSSLPPQFERKPIVGAMMVIDRPVVSVGESFETLLILKPVIHICITVFLVRVVREAAKLRVLMRRNEVDRTESTTRLITMTTVFYFFSEIPGWFKWVYRKLAADDTRYLIYSELFEVPIVFFTSVNSISHFFVCFFMSSQYRDTVKALFGRARSSTTMLTAEVATGSIPINTLTT
uniref:G_PROTEIN_RECEP_F1_2 domain-containing protein n=1 Tax=Caenorhabditis tropicalis TaxID=1561998 RepID=A0A1I7UI65_9PELO